MLLVYYKGRKAGTKEERNGETFSMVLKKENFSKGKKKFIFIHNKG